MANTGDIYFVNPFLFSTLKKNPFKDTARIADVDFGCRQSYATSIHLNLPQNFIIDEVPTAKIIRMEGDDILFKIQYFTSANSLLIRTEFTVNKPVFDKDEYKIVHTFFDKVYALINEQVVLKRKGE